MFYGTALQAESMEGHSGIVKFLVDNGADIDTPGGRYGTALSATLQAVPTNDEIVKLLLDHRAKEAA